MVLFLKELLEKIGKGKKRSLNPLRGHQEALQGAEIDFKGPGGPELRERLRNDPRVYTAINPPLYIGDDMKVHAMQELKYGETWWELKNSKIMPFSCHEEEKEFETEDWYFKISFTREGWLEQTWELKTKTWIKWVTQEEYMKEMFLEKCIQ